MKRQGFIPVLVMSATMLASAAFATDATQLGTGALDDAAARNMVNQIAIADDISAQTGVASNQVQKIVIKNTSGTFIPAANRVLVNDANYGTTNTAAQDKTLELMATVMATGGNADLGSIVQSAAEADMRVLTGDFATAAANIGGMTGSAIGGGGGVIDTRVASILDERRNMVEQFGSNTSLASAMMNENFANRIWASPFYTKQNMSRKDGHAAYDYKAWGVSVGYDRAFGNLTVGAAFTYSRGDYDESGVHDDNTIDNYGFSLYANYYFNNNFFTTLSGGYNYGDNDMKRWVTNVGTPGWQVSDNHTDTYWLGGKLGYDYKATSAFTLTPTVGLFWTESRGSAYTSTGAAGNLHISKIKNKAFLLPIDLTARYKIDLGCDNSLTLRASGGYAYNFKKDGAKGHMNYDFDNSLPVIINGVKPGRSSWNAGAGVTYQYKRFDFGVDYRYDGKKKYNAHRVSGTVGISF